MPSHQGTEHPKLDYEALQLEDKVGTMPRATSSFKRAVKAVPRSLQMIQSHQYKQLKIRASSHRLSVSRSCSEKSSTVYRGTLRRSIEGLTYLHTRQTRYALLI